ncbi:MAG: TlpA family protein disulfide reductase [Patiriisocius sp.]|uniref:TlpA family protein disulfide reductase n=1 Tax=Patiriisocius sp. TaxID=2822396 RepID=UPI003EF50999
MKRIILILAAIAIISCETKEENTDVAFNATFANTGAPSITIVGADYKEDLTLDSNGTVTDTLDIPSTGFYNIVLGRDRMPIYLEQGKSLTIKMDAKSPDAPVFEGPVAAENVFAREKSLRAGTTNPMELYADEENVYLESMAANKKTEDSLLTASGIKNETFLKVLNDEEIYTTAFTHNMYPQYHAYITKNDDFKASSSFASLNNGVNVSDTTAYRNSMAYQQMVDNKIQNDAYEAFMEDESEDKDMTMIYLEHIDSLYPNGFAKEKMVTQYLQYGLSPNESLEEVYAAYKKINPSEKNLAEVTKRYNELKVLTKGNASPTFKYENHKGGETALADLKGKYTYIDVWATWCGPCIGEIPSLKQVEKDNHDKNIEFVSISIDRKADYEKWRKMVTEKELGGIQLMADNDWKSAFVTDYAITGIPRFILVDPDGNIVSADAPRPSDPQLRKMLDKLI